VRSEPADESPKDNPAPETSEQTAEQPEYVKSKPKHIVKQTQPEQPPLKIEVAPIKDRTQQQPKTTSVKSKSPGNKPTPEKKGAKTTDKKPMQLAKVGNYSRQSRDYQSKLLQLIERNKYYPLKARRSGMEGTSTVAFTVRGNGNIRGISLARSSGTQLLDQAAIQTIKRIGHAPPLPGGRNSWRFTVPILYNLK
jgi:protein TonB